MRTFKNIVMMEFNFWRYLRYALVSAGLLFILLLSFLVAGHYLIQKPQFQEALINRLTNNDYSIKTGEVRINLWPGFGILIHDLEIGSEMGLDSLRVQKARIILDARGLLKRRLEVTSIYLYQPHVRTSLSLSPLSAIESQMHLDFFSLSFLPLWIPSVSIVDGACYFFDHGLLFKAFDMSISQKKADPAGRIVQGRAKIHYQDAVAQLTFNGLVTQTAADPVFGLEVEVKRIPLSWIPFGPYVNIHTGFAEAQLDIEGSSVKDIGLTGKIKILSPAFSIQLREKKWHSVLPDMDLEFVSRLNQQKIDLTSLKLISGDVTISGLISVDFEEKNNPDLRLDVTSSPMGLEIFKNICPVPLFSPWIDNNLYPLFLSGEIKTNRFNIKGTYDQLRKIRHQENYSLIGLDLECRNFTLEGGRPDLPFKDVVAQVILDNGELSILNFTADFGRSTITRGNLVIPDVYRADPSFEAQVPGNFQFADLSVQTKMPLFSPMSSVWTSQLDLIEGTTEGQIDIQYESAWKTPRIIKGQLNMQDCVVSPKSLIMPIRIISGNIEIDPQAGNRFEGFSHWGKTSFHAKGGFFIDDGKITLGETEINGQADLGEIFSSFYYQGHGFFSFAKPMLFSLRLLEQPGYYTGLGTIKLESVSMDTGYIRAGPSGDQGLVEFDLDYWPGARINLKKAVYYLEDSFLELTGYYSLAGTEKYFGHIQMEGFSLLPLGLHLKSNQKKLEGKLSGDLKIEGHTGKPSEIRLWGKLVGNDFSLGMEPVLGALDNCHFLFHFNGRDIIIDELNMMVGKSPFRVRGMMKGWTGWKAQLDIDSTFLDLESLLPELNQLPVKSFPGGEWGDIGLKLSLSFQGGIWKSIKLGSSRVQLALENGILSLQEIFMNLEHGTVKASGRVKGGETGEISLAGMVKLTEQPLEEVTRSFNIFYDRIKGPLSLTMAFQMEGQHYQDLIPSLNGSVEMLIGNGLIKDTRLFIKILDLLNLQNIFRKRPPDLKEEGFFFESMSGYATILNGVLKSENFIIRSPIFNAVGYGEIDLANKTADFFLGTQPHNTIDALISSIPVLGYIIAGKNKAILTYYFKVTGAIDDLEVKLVPLESLGKGVTGIIKRLLLTPLGRFK